MRQGRKCRSLGGCLSMYAFWRQEDRRRGHLSGSRSAWIAGARRQMQVLFSGNTAASSQQPESDAAHQGIPLFSRPFMVVLAAYPATPIDDRLL